jgi:DNA-binding transcriptional LysR family regulator
MDMPSLRQLRTFVAVVERGSVTEAARALHLTQPAASQQLRELERMLGAKLLERAEGRVIPTAAGAAMLAPARRALAGGEEVAAAALAWRDGGIGRVRLGTGATACIYLLPPVLAAARRAMPGLEIVVATGNTPEILRQVQEGALDLGLVTLPRVLARGLNRTPLRRDAMVALVPEGWAQGDAVPPEMLGAMPLILYEAGGDTRRVVDAWFGAAGLAPRPIMELGSVEAIKVLVGSGLGASVLPEMALGGGVAGARVLALRPAVARELGVVMRAEKLLDRGLRVLLEALRAVDSSV